MSDEELKERAECKHEQFYSGSTITRLTDKEGSEEITGYRVDVKVHCMQCGHPFEWIGLPGGFNPFYPTVSADGLELRAPLRPSNMPIQKIPGKLYN